MLCRYRPMTLLLLLTATLLVACTSSQQTSTPTAAQAIEENKEIDRQLIRAVTTADVPALMNLVWKDPAVTFMGPQGKIARGWDRIYEIEKREYNPANKITAEVLEAIHVPYGDTLLAILTVKVIENPQDASPQEFTARITDLRKKEGGKWVVVYNHTHILPPPSATEEK